MTVAIQPICGVKRRAGRGGREGDLLAENPVLRLARIGRREKRDRRVDREYERLLVVVWRRCDTKRRSRFHATAVEARLVRRGNVVADADVESQSRHSRIAEQPAYSDEIRTPPAVPVADAARGSSSVR